MDQIEEGWCTDPYDRHEQRWFSGGNPTKLVQDKGVTSYDPPPDGPPNHLPQKVETRPNLGSADLQRADDAERAPDLDHGEIYMRQMDAAWSDGAPLNVMWPHDALHKHVHRRMWRLFLGLVVALLLLGCISFLMTSHP